jgi:glycosyltransferase involved in cell wall biosynthesis
MLTRHCIVTPQFPGITRNGGLGTHCYYLAQFLEKRGDHTTLLYTQPDLGGLARARLPFHLNFVWTEELPPIPCLYTTWFLQASARCYEWLKNQHFDFIHFQDWLGNGFRSVQAKRTGQAFAETTLTCMLNGPSLWTRQGMKVDPYSTRDDMLMDYIEAYTARHCDQLLSPSRYALDWARDHWKIDHPRPHLLPYLFQAPFREKAEPGEIQHLIFFGRLETRKGLELFLDALLLLDRQGAPRRQVSFVGSRAPLRGVDSGAYIDRFFHDHLPGWSYRILDQFDHAEALDFLRASPHKLVVIPSLSETLCYTVLECMECNFNFIAARAGGIPELLEESDRLFDPTAAALAHKLAQAFSGPPLQHRARWSAAATEKKWSAFFEATTPARTAAPPGRPPPRLPLVSVCVPHYNGYPLLEQTLVALHQQTYPNFEVFVRDDASTDPVSQEEFARLAASFGKMGWSFTRNEVNRGPGFTRNRMAEMAAGEYLLFVDADNVPGRQMIERMVTGALAANLDATGCIMKTVLMDKPLHSHQAVHNTWMPVGPALPVIFFGNLVGETNTLFRASVFWKIGGFPEDANYGNEDWELLIRLILAGFAFDIVPEFLFLYRIRESSNVRVTPSIHNRLRAWRPLFDHLPPEKQFLATSLFVWEWRIEENNHPQAPPIPRELVGYQSSFFYRLHRFFRHPKKTLAPFFQRRR